MLLATSSTWIVDALLTGLGEKIEDAFNQLPTLLTGQFIDKFKPNMDTFYTLMGNQAITDSLFQIFTILGIVIVLVLLVINIVLPAFASFFDVRQAPGESVVRAIVGVLFVLYGKTIITHLQDISLSLWDRFSTVNAATLGSNTFSLGIKNLFKLSTWQASPFFGALYLIPFFGQLIIIVLIFLVFKEILRLLVEIIEKYLITGLLYYAFPVASSTIASRDTSTIFASYMRLVVSQLFLLLTNYITFTICTHVLCSGYMFLSLTNYLIFYALVRMSRRIDSYMQSMGLNVAHQAGNLLDSCAFGLGAVAMGLSSLSRSAGNMTRGVGNATYALGAANGNPGLMKAGALMAQPLSAGNTGKMVMDMSASGGKISTPYVSNDLAKAFANPYDFRQSGMVGNIVAGNQAATNDMFKKTFNNDMGALASSMGVKGIDSSNISLSPKAGGYNAPVSLGQNSDGSPISGIANLSHNQTKGSIPLTDSFGNQWYASVDMNEPLQPGSAISTDAVYNGNALESNDAITSNLGFDYSDFMDTTSLQEGDTASADIKATQNGFEIFQDDKAVGYVDKSTGKEAHLSGLGDYSMDSYVSACAEDLNERFGMVDNSISVEKTDASKYTVEGLNDAGEKIAFNVYSPSTATGKVKMSSRNSDVITTVNEESGRKASMVWVPVKNSSKSESSSSKDEKNSRRRKK